MSRWGRVARSYGRPELHDALDRLPRRDYRMMGTHDISALVGWFGLGVGMAGYDTLDRLHQLSQRQDTTAPLETPMNDACMTLGPWLDISYHVLD